MPACPAAGANAQIGPSSVSPLSSLPGGVTHLRDMPQVLPGLMTADRGGVLPAKSSSGGNIKRKRVQEGINSAQIRVYSQQLRHK